jgi:hypothetical protein
LFRACCNHTDGTLSADSTIATCWDADRLDLGRVGIVPDPAFMSTMTGRELACRVGGEIVRRRGKRYNLIAVDGSLWWVFPFARP